MALNFPSSPTTGDVHTASGRSWTWDGVSWVSGTTLDNYYNKIESDDRYYTKTQSDANYDPAGEAVALSIALG